MEQRTLVPDAGEVVLDQLRVEGLSRLVMFGGRPAGRAFVRLAGMPRAVYTVTTGGS
jgi:hypothetical protein